MATPPEAADSEVGMPFRPAGPTPTHVGKKWRPGRVARGSARTNKPPIDTFALMAAGHPPPQWMTCAWWITTGQAIGMIEATMTVPPPPINPGFQTLYHFVGLQDANPVTFIVQPVLQWTQAAGWEIVSCYVRNDGRKFPSGSVAVAPGQTLTARITNLGPSGSEFIYQSEWLGFDQTVRQVSYRRLDMAVATLEAYGVAQCSDYPSVAGLQMTGVSLTSQTGANLPVNWQPSNITAVCHEQTKIPSNQSPNGVIDLLYR